MQLKMDLDVRALVRINMLSKSINHSIFVYSELK